jgi:hypothetical protein
MRKVTVRSDLLKRAGEALYGERWQSSLSRDLGVTDRTVRNWAAERNDCPDDVPSKLLDLLRHRGESMMKLTTAIEQHLGTDEKPLRVRPAAKQD